MGLFDLPFGIPGLPGGTPGLTTGVLHGQYLGEKVPYPKSGWQYSCISCFALGAKGHA